jgi:hypothetical protein
MCEELVTSQEGLCSIDAGFLGEASIQLFYKHPMGEAARHGYATALNIFLMA